MSYATFATESRQFTNSHRSTGVSDASRLLEGMIAGSTRQLFHSTIVSVERDDTFTELLETYSDCSAPNWDGYGAQAVKPDAVIEALHLVGVVPREVTMPAVCPEPDGYIGLEWHDKRGKTFVVSLNGSSEITYAGILGGGNKVHGYARFMGTIPRSIRDILVQHFSRGSKKTGGSRVL